MDQQTTPGGLSWRLIDGPVNKDVTADISGQSITWALVGGCSHGEAKVDLPPSTFPTISNEQARLIAYSPLGDAIWEGIVTDPGITLDDEAEYLDLGVTGSMMLASLRVMPLVYLDAELDGWQPSPNLPDARRADSGEGVLTAGFQAGFPVGSGAVAGFDWTRLTHSEQSVGAVSMTVQSGVTTGWVVDVIALADGVATTAASWAASTVATPRTVTLPAGTDTVRVQMRRTGAATNVSTDTVWTKLSDLRVIGSRVDRYGVAATDPAGDLTSADVVEDLIGRGMLGPVDAAGAVVEDSAAVLKALSWPEGVRGSQVLDALREQDPAMTWAYGVKRERGYEFGWTRLSTSARYDVLDVDAVTWQGDDVQPCQRVRVVYTDAAGVLRSTVVTLATEPGELVRDADPITMDGTHTEAEAVAEGERALAELANPEHAATVGVDRLVKDRWLGVDVEPYETRPGSCRMPSGDVVVLNEVTWAADGAEWAVGTEVLSDADKIRAIERGDIKPGVPLITLPPSRPAPAPPLGLPTNDPTDPPATSPTVRLAPHTTGFIVVAEDVAITTLIEYHVSTVNGFTPDASTLLATTRSQVQDFRTLPDASPMVKGTTYYFRTIASNVAGIAAPSAQVSGQIRSVDSSDLSDVLAQTIADASTDASAAQTAATDAQGAAAAAQSDADAAAAAALAAQSTADSATTAAGTAQSTADDAATLAATKGKLIVQVSAPAGANAVPENLWIDTSGAPPKNTPKRWDGSAWVAVTDKVALDAAAQALTAYNNAATAQARADAAYDQAVAASTAAGTAQTTANGKGTVWYAASPPPGGANDVWFETDNDFLPHRWDGSAWVATPFGDAAIGNLDVGKLTALGAAIQVLTVGDVYGENAYLGNVNADQITSGQVAAALAILGELNVGPASWTPDDGITIPGVNGFTTRLGTDGSAVFDRVTTQYFKLVGLFNAIEGILTLANSINPPAAPRLSLGPVPAVQAATSFVAASAWCGLADFGTSWGVGLPFYGGGLISRYDKGTGSTVSWSPTIANFQPYGGVVQLGSSYFVLGQDGARGSAWYVYKYDSAWNKTGELLMYASSAVQATLGTDGTNLVIERRATDDGRAVARYTTAFAGIDSVTLPSWAATPTGVVWDTARSRILVASTTEIRAHNSSTGARVTADDVPRPGGVTTIRGLGWDGTRLHILDSTGKIHALAQRLTSTTVTATVTAVNSGGTVQTTPSEVSTYTLKAGQYLRAEANPLNDDGDPLKPKRVQFFVSAPSTRLAQGVLAEGTLVQTWDTIATGGATEPTVNGFDSLGVTPGAWRSDATDADGPLAEADGGGKWRFAGGGTDIRSDGTVKLANMASGEVSISGSAVAAGGAVFVTVTFAAPFATAPHVIVGMNGGPGGSNYLVPRANSITTTSFRAYVYNTGTAAATWTGLAVDWIAHV